MVGRRDQRSYAEVVPQPCGSNFSTNLCTMANNTRCSNTEVKCDVVYTNSTLNSANRLAATGFAGTLHSIEEMSFLNSDLDSVRLAVNMDQDLHATGKNTISRLKGNTGGDLWENLPIRFCVFVMLLGDATP